MAWYSSRPMPSFWVQQKTVGTARISLFHSKDFFSYLRSQCLTVAFILTFFSKVTFSLLVQYDTRLCLEDFFVQVQVATTIFFTALNNPFSFPRIPFRISCLPLR
jgi:hypothetical protein